MSVTAVEIPQEDRTKKRLQFFTQQFEEGIFVGVRQCNEDWVAVGEPAETTDPRNEDVYHKELREMAHERGQFVAQYSTNPEWNPGYIEPKEEDENTI